MVGTGTAQTTVIDVSTSIACPQAINLNEMLVKFKSRRKR
jgi:hypothetical protein